MALDLTTIQESYDEYQKLLSIGKANTLVNEMEREVEKYTKLLELARANQVQVITHNVNSYPYLTWISGAKDYFFKIADKRTKEHRYNETAFNNLTKQLSELFNAKITIVNFSSGGYEGYYEEVDFQVKGINKIFTFSIPNVEKINIKNFKNAYEGKYAIGELCEYMHTIKETSYNIDDIKQIFNCMINGDIK